MSRCRQCDAEMEEGSKVCPHCGHFHGEQLEPTSKGAAVFQSVIGFLAGFLSPLLFGIGYIVAIIMYFVIRRNYPVFAKGMLVGILTLLAIMAGLLATCFVILVAMSKGH